MKHKWVFEFEKFYGKFIKYKQYECKKCECVKSVSVFIYHNGKTQILDQYSRHQILLGLTEPICQKIE